MCVCVSMSGCMCVNVSKEHGKKQKRMSHVCLDIFCVNISEEYGIFDLQILSRTKFSLLDIKTLPFTLLSVCMEWTSCNHTPAHTTRIATNYDLWPREVLHFWIYRYIIVCFLLYISAIICNSSGALLLKSLQLLIKT